jgi:hypothetical protein
MDGMCPPPLDLLPEGRIGECSVGALLACFKLEEIVQGAYLPVRQARSRSETKLGKLPDRAFRLGQRAKRISEQRCHQTMKIESQVEPVPEGTEPVSRPVHSWHRSRTPMRYLGNWDAAMRTGRPKVESMPIDE